MAGILVSGRYALTVKPNASKDEILELDKEKRTIKVAVAAPPEKNKANLALLKFLKKQSGKKVFLVAGNTSKDKIVEFADE